MHGIGAVPDKALPRLAVLRRWPNAAPILLGVLLVTAIALLDWATGPDISVSILYALAVTLVTWTGTARHGYLVAALAATDSLAANAISADQAMVPRAADVWNASTTLIVLSSIAGLLGLLRGALVEQRRLAMVDPLTGALNRRSLQIAAERERLRSAREGSPLSVAYIDLDGFKGINDRLGHRVGDRLLATFSALVIESIRGSDLFARIGGDEFVVMLPDTGAREAVGVLDRIRSVVAERCFEDAPLTVSIGIGTYHFPPATVDALIAGADDLMYRAKRAGGDRIVGSVVSGPWLRWGDHSLLPAKTSKEATPL